MKKYRCLSMVMVLMSLAAGVASAQQAPTANLAGSQSTAQAHVQLVKHHHKHKHHRHGNHQV